MGPPDWNGQTNAWEPNCLRCRSEAACPDGKSCGEFVLPHDDILDAGRPCGRCKAGTMLRTLVQ